MCSVPNLNIGRTRTPQRGRTSEPPNRVSTVTRRAGGAERPGFWAKRTSPGRERGFNTEQTPPDGRFEIAPTQEFPSDPASRRGRLVYRRPVLTAAASWPATPQNPDSLAIWPPGGCALGSRPFQRVEVRTPCVSGSVRQTPLSLSRSLVDGVTRVNCGSCCGDRYDQDHGADSGRLSRFRQRKLAPDSGPIR